MAGHKIDSKTARKGLPERIEPYWKRVRRGAHLGYRKKGEGTWIAKYRDEDSGQRRYKALGTFASKDKQDACDLALIEANKFFADCEAGISTQGETVADACRRYIDRQCLHKGATAANDITGRFRRLVFDQPIGKVKLAKLRKKQVADWRDAMLVASNDKDEVRRAKESSNRNLANLKAALNLALSDQLVATDAAWKSVTAFSDVRGTRKGFLTVAERQRLLDVADAPLAGLCKAVLLTAARPGELADATVANFDKRRGRLTLNGKTGERTVELSDAAVALFAETSKGKIGNAPLLSRADGSKWNRFGWRDVFKDAAHKAKLPGDTVLYLLRHCAISEMLAGGVDVAAVARLSGTSIAMIQQTYGKDIPDINRARLNKVRML